MNGGFWSQSIGLYFSIPINICKMLFEITKTNFILSFMKVGQTQMNEVR